MKFIASKKRFIVAMLLSLMVASCRRSRFCRRPGRSTCPRCCRGNSCTGRSGAQPIRRAPTPAAPQDDRGDSAGAPTADDLNNLGPEPLA